MDNLQDIINEANKCLNCKNPLCKKGCPIETKIPEFINEIKQNNLEKAYEILQENNIMSDVCSNVCPFEEYCLGHCVRGIKGKPVNIPKLEKYINIWARENNVQYEYKKEEQNEMNIAIIGSGPSGLECAAELAKRGFNVTIFEREKEIGGLLSYGIPGFRLPRNITDKLTTRILSLGINIKTNIELGKDITVKKLKEEFDAVFIGIGADVPSTYCLCEKACNNIYNSNYILREYNAKRIIKNLGDVIIIGGGNVATDCARAVIRMGAKSSTIVYRRDIKKMPAREDELKAAVQDGVEIIYNTKVISVDIENDKIKAAKCIKTETVDDEIKDLKDSEFFIKANSIVYAIGLKLDKKLVENEGIEINERDLIKIDKNYMTNIDGVFAGGDATQNKSTVCMAVNNGKKAAEEIEKYCKNRNRL